MPLHNITDIYCVGLSVFVLSLYVCVYFMCVINDDDDDDDDNDNSFAV